MEEEIINGQKRDYGVASYEVGVHLENTGGVLGVDLEIVLEKGEYVVNGGERSRAK